MSTPTPCTATVGASLVERADNLADLLAVCEDLFETGLGEDLAIWEGNRLVAVWMSDGRRLGLRPRQLNRRA
jgi:hypothetical protein